MPLLLLTLAARSHANGEGVGADPIETVQLSPVKVTARLRPEYESHVPISLVVADGEALEREGRFSLGRLDSRVANLQLGDLNGTPALFMRGVGGGGRQVAFEPRVGIYVDGVFMNVPPLTDALLLDLDRVEVLRGPQGSLFGQNTVAGAINLITREPGEEFALQSQVRLGSEGERRLGLAMDAPLVDDSLLLRISGNLAEDRGQTVNLQDGERLDAYDQAGGRLRLQWRAAPGLVADLAADTSNHRDDFPSGEAFSDTQGGGPDANPGAYTVALDAPQRDDLRSSGVTGTIRWTSPLGDLTSISAWRSARRHWAVDVDYSTDDGWRSDFVDRYERWSQELRLASRTSASRLSWLGGLNAFRQTAQSHRPLYSGEDIQMFVPPLSPGDTLIVEPRIDTRSVALFGSIGYALRADLRLDAGLRLLTLRQELAYTQQSTAGFQAIGLLPVDNYRDSNRQHALLPDLALSWDFSPDVTVYVRYAKGSKSGGYDADSLGFSRTEPSSFSEETVDSYEIGLKGGWFEQRLQAGLALFLAEYRDYQVSQFRPVDNNLVAPVVNNAGKVRSYGPELELQWRPLRGLTLRNSTAWLSSTYADFRDGGGIGVDFSGNRTEFAPRWSVNSLLTYRRPVSWRGVAVVEGAVSYSWRSRYYTQPSNLPAFEADIRRLLGVRLGVFDASGRLDVGVFADNLLDERYVETLNRGTLGTLYGRYGAPRSFGLQIQYRCE